MEKQQLSKIVAKGEFHFRNLAEKAKTQEEKISFLKCAEASARLAPKIAELESSSVKEGLLNVIERFPEHKELIKERIFRFRLNVNEVGYE